MRKISVRIGIDSTERDAHLPDLGELVGRVSEVQARRKDGHHFAAELSVSRMTEPDDIHFVLILRNLADTAERAAEIHVNEGVCDIFDIVFPPKGTLMTPEWPAATNARSFVLLRCLGLLAGVVAQGARPHGQQQIGVVGKFPRPVLGMRPGEQHQHGHGQEDEAVEECGIEDRHSPCHHALSIFSQRAQAR